MSLEEFGERLKVNLIKKWNQFENGKLDEDFPLYTWIEFSNKVPIAVEYKNIKLLGDKFCIHISDHPTAQILHIWPSEQEFVRIIAEGLGL